MGTPVNFKRGTQASLNTLINGTGNRYLEGTFYLTTDTDRLYFAQSATELVDLNQYIHIFSGSSLPSTATSGYSNLEEGDIYYWKDQNILAICKNPSAGTWVQLNPDTYLETNGANITITQDNSDSSKYNFDLLVADSKGHQSEGEFSLKGGTNVTLSQSGSVITINSTDTNDNATYELTTEANTITNRGILTLGGTGTGATATTVTFKGQGAVTLSSTTGNEIIINGSGGVSGISHSIDANGNFSTTLDTSDGNIDSNDIQPIIRYGENSNVTAAFASGTANLSVYTKAEVDSKISASEAAANAMVYSGTVTGSDASTKIVSTANVGTTYKASANFTKPNNVDAPSGVTQVKVGDLLIAKGTDGNVTWDLIPSGDDQNITTSISGNTLTITDTLNVDDLGSITINGSTGNYGTIAVSSATSGNALTLTVSHGAAGTGSAFDNSTIDTNTTQVANHTIDVPVITGISKDSAGHVTSVSGATYRITDTHANISSVSSTISSTTSTSATLTFEVMDTDNISDDAVVRITSNNLEISSTTANNVNLDFVWGTF